MPAIRSHRTPPPVDREIRLAGGDTRWRVPEETPVALIYNGRNYAVMLATPSDLADFAVGFSLTERIVETVNEIESIDLYCDERGVDVRLTVTEKAVERFDVRQQRRNLVGRSGCGVCGIENAEVFFEQLPSVSEHRLIIPEEILLKAAGELPTFQPLNRRTHTVHAAAWASSNGAIRIAREDVGRHNALDKLLGAMALGGVSTGEGFVVMSSRCSYEIVEKAARLGVRAVLSISAPTAFAIRKAKEANMALYVMAGDSVVAID